jgi:hypothetical protein
MSRQPVRPKAIHEHEAAAHAVLGHYARVAGWAPRLPVPVEQIIERCHGLYICWEPLPESPGEIVLGALDPPTRTIVMNETHASSILRRLGPTNFTFGHELGHWLYDAIPPEQGTLLDAGGERVLCQGSLKLPDAARLREVNANKFAACLLMPRHLVLQQFPNDPSAGALQQCADAWGVSRQALVIRLGELGLVGPKADGGLFRQ